MRLTRRNFLKVGTAVLGGGLLSIGVWKLLEDLYIDSNESLPIPTPTKEATTIHVPNAKYFEQLESVIRQIQQRDDLENLRHVYSGNVNDFDRDGVNVSQGSMIRREGGRSVHTIEMYTDPETGKPVTRQYTEEVTSPDILEITIFIPRYMVNTVRNKKDTIRMLYLDSGREDPFRKVFEQAGYSVENSIRRLLPGVDIRVEQKVMKWNPNTEVYWGIVSGGIDSDKVQDGKFRLSDEYRYILFTEVPLNVILTDKRTNPGFAHLYKNLAVVQLRQHSNKNYENIVETVLMEAGHMYGVPHCWEPQCAMSYRDLIVRGNPVVSFGERCLMIGKNIGGGQIIEVKDENNPKAYFESGRLVPEEEAKRDLESNLQAYFSDILPVTRPQGIELETLLGRKVDTVRFYQNGELKMGLEIPDFISLVKTY